MKANTSTILLLSVCCLLAASSASAFLISPFHGSHFTPVRWMAPRRHASGLWDFDHEAISVLDTFHSMEKVADQLLGTFMDCQETCSKPVEKEANANATANNETAVHLPSLHSWKLGPRFNIQESPEGFTVMVATPGLEKSDVNVEIVDDDGSATILVVSGGSKDESKEESQDKSAPARVGRYANFERRLRLPSTIDKDSISAKYDNGMLSISLKHIEKKPSLRSHVAIA